MVMAYWSFRTRPLQPQQIRWSRTREDSIGQWTPLESKFDPSFPSSFNGQTTPHDEINIPTPPTDKFQCPISSTFRSESPRRPFTRQLHSRISYKKPGIIPLVLVDFYGRTDRISRSGSEHPIERSITSRKCRRIRLRLRIRSRSRDRSRGGEVETIIKECEL